MNAQPAISGRTRLAAVIGSPVQHSLSPALHNAAFAALGLDWVYVALPVAEGQADTALDAMRLFGIGGLSVTMPHKEQVAASVDRRVADLRAKLVGAPASEAMMFAAMTFADDLAKERAKYAADLAAARAQAEQLRARLAALAGR